MDHATSDAALGASQILPADEHFDESLTAFSTPVTGNNEAHHSPPPQSRQGHDHPMATDSPSNTPFRHATGTSPGPTANDGHQPSSGSVSQSQSMRAAPSIRDSTSPGPMPDMHKSSSGLSPGPGPSTLHARFEGHGLAAARRSVSDTQIGSLVDNIHSGMPPALRPTGVPANSNAATPLSGQRASYSIASSPRDSRSGMAVGMSPAASVSGQSSQPGSLGGLMVPGASPAVSHYFMSTGSPSGGISGASIANSSAYAGYRYPAAVPVVHDPQNGQPHYIPVQPGMPNIQHVPGGSYLALSPIVHPQPAMSAHLPVNVRRAIRQVHHHQTLDPITGQSNTDIAPTVNIDITVGSASEIDLDLSEIVPTIDGTAGAKEHDAERESAASTNDSSLPYFTLGRSALETVPRQSTMEQRDASTFMRGTLKGTAVRTIGRTSGGTIPDHITFATPSKPNTLTRNSSLVAGQKSPVRLTTFPLSALVGGPSEHNVPPPSSLSNNGNQPSPHSASPGADDQSPLLGRAGTLNKVASSDGGSGARTAEHKHKTTDRIQLPDTPDKVKREWWYNYVPHEWLATQIHSPGTKFWVRFDLVVRFTDIFLLIFIPIVAGFPCDFGAEYAGLFLILDAFYILRVALQLFRPAVDEYGEPAVDFKKRRELYLNKRMGWYEIFGAVPVDSILYLVMSSLNDLASKFDCANPYYMFADGSMAAGMQSGKAVVSVRFGAFTFERGLFSLFKILRLFASVNTMKWLLTFQLSLLSSPATRLLKNFVMGLYLTHLDTCAWFYLQSNLDKDKRWLANERVLYEDDGVTPTDWNFRYVTCFLSAQRSLFFSPRSTRLYGEALYQILEFLFAACAFGSILGNLSQIVRSFDTQAVLDKVAKNRSLQRKMLGQYMIKQHFPVGLQVKVLDQEEFEWIHAKGLNTEQIFLQLPRPLRLEVYVHLYYQLVSSVPIFKNTDDLFKVALCERISMITVRAGFYICKAGDQGDEMYFIRRGKVDIYTRDETKLLVSLGTGAFFGEVALYMESTRSATAKTAMDSELCILKKADFDAILELYPNVREEFRMLIQKRAENDAAKGNTGESKHAPTALKGNTAVVDPRLLDAHLNSGGLGSKLSRRPGHAANVTTSTAHGLGLGGSTVLPTAYTGGSRLVLGGGGGAGGAGGGGVHTNGRRSDG